MKPQMIYVSSTAGKASFHIHADQLYCVLSWYHWEASASQNARWLLCPSLKSEVWSTSSSSYFSEEPALNEMYPCKFNSRVDMKFTLMLCLRSQALSSKYILCFIIFKPNDLLAVLRRAFYKHDLEVVTCFRHLLTLNSSCKTQTQCDWCRESSILCVWTDVSYT